MKIVISFLVFAVSLPKSLGVDLLGFEQTGSDVLPPNDAPNPERNFGAMLSLTSLDGKRLAVGHPSGNGVVNIFEYDDETDKWNRFQRFEGRNGEQMGRRFDMSSDGSRIAIRQILNGFHAIQVYNVDTGAKVGQFLHCTTHGLEVSLSGDGNTVALSCEGFDYERGTVKVFTLANNGVWKVKGNFLEGEIQRDNFGYSTGLTETGHRIIIGAPSFEGENGAITDRGSVTIYEFDTNKNKWNIIGSPLLGQAFRDRFGYKVAISGDGRSCLASAPGLGIKPFTSYVRTYIELRGMWLLTGPIIETEQEQFDGPLLMNANGSRIAFASSKKPLTNNVRVYEIEDGVFARHGQVISWEAVEGDNDRKSLAIGGDHVAFATVDNDGEPVVKVVHTVPYGNQVINLDDQLGSGEWDIEVVDITVQFNDDDPSNEIRAVYRFNQHPFSYEVLELDCYTPVESDIIKVNANSGSIPGGKYELELFLDVNAYTIATSPIYENINEEKSMLALCLRVDLLDDQDGDLVQAVSEKNRLYIEIDLTQGLELQDVGVEDGTVFDFDLEVSLDYEVIACQCDRFLKCVDDILWDESKDAYICVKTSDPFVEIASVQELYLTQGEGLTQTTVSQGMAVAPFAAMEKFGETVVIQIHLLSAFFAHPTPEDVLAFGSCVLKFKNDDTDSKTRLLSSIIQQRQRSVRQNWANETSFNLSFHLEAKDDESGDSSSGFDRKIFMAVVIGVLLLCFCLV